MAPKRQGQGQALHPSKAASRAHYWRRREADCKALFGEFSPIVEEGITSLAFLRQPSVVVLSETFFVSRDLHNFARLGFKYCPESTPSTAIKDIARAIFHGVPLLRDKVGRILVQKNQNKPVPWLRPPPASWIPNLDWGNFPLWEDFFRKLKSSLWEDFRGLGDLDLFTKKSVCDRQHWIQKCVEEVILNDHFFAKADKDTSMIVVSKNIFQGAEQKLLDSLKLRKIPLPAKVVVGGCKDFLRTCVDHLDYLGVIPKTVMKWLELGFDLDTLPKLQLLFKTHKPREKWWLGGSCPPCRPIVTQHLWLTKNCSKVLSGFLQRGLNGIRGDHPLLLLQNSFSFVEHLEKNGIFGKKKLVATADFESLYSNLPIPLVVEAVTNLAKKFKDNVGDGFLHCIVWPGSFLTAFPDFLPSWNLPIPTVLHLLLMLVLSLNVFIAPNGSIFAQIEGIAMGLGCAPLLADITLAYIEARHKSVFEGKIVARYLDDMCVIADDLSDLDQITSCYPLQLSWSVAASSCCFLDIRIFLEEGIKTGVFFKPENNAIYIPFSSAHTWSQKTSWLKGELIRYIRICSEESMFDRARTRFVFAALARGYPCNLLRKMVRSIPWEDRIKFLGPRKVLRSPVESISVGFKIVADGLRIIKCPASPEGLIRPIRVPPRSILNWVQTSQKPILHIPSI